VKKRGGRWVGLLGAEHLESHLRDAENRYALSLELLEPGAEAPRPGPDRLQRALEVGLWKDRLLLASRSRMGLREALASLDGSVVAISLAALGLASLIAVWLSSGLARPVVAFAERARAAISGTPEPLPLRGGPELVQAARAFNQTLEDLAGLRERLEVTERIAARREVARQIAHEIKNPLSPIRASIETLRRLRARGAEEFDDYFDEATKTVLHEVRRMDELVRAFSEYANLPPPALEHFELAELAGELAQLHGGLGAKIEVDLSPGSRVLADRNQLSQVVTNLLKNALEATASSATAEQPATLRLAVRAHDRAGKRWVALSLADDGPGVPAELAAKIFDPYVTTKGHGTGLGLAISRRIAVEHGGDLRLEPGVGRGATFTLELPADGPSTSI
jgi:nitrogen fixation/metabolism regulation signal transduction histidine kinase